MTFMAHFGGGNDFISSALGKVYEALRMEVEGYIDSWMSWIRPKL
jgi:hypothetical protein